MWGTNSLSNRYQSNTNKISFDPLKNNYIHQNPNPAPLPEYNMLCQTPIKQLEYNQNNNNFATTPFRFDFNHYFGNLWSSGKIPNNQLLQPQMFLSPTHLNKDNLPLNKKGIDESYKLTPLSQLKYSNSSNNSSNNSNNNNNNLIMNNNNNNMNKNNINIPQNNNISNNNGYINPNNNINGKNNINNFSYNNNNGCNTYFNGYNNNNGNNNISNNSYKNINELTKKNLNELFNNAKNQTSLYDEQKHKFIKNFNNFNNYNILNINNFNNNNNHMNNPNYINKTKTNEPIKNKNYNLQISRQFIFSSPLCNKPKKIFECSGSTVATLSSNKNINKNRRFRKNNEQISLLKKFYNEHKHWSKNQIKEISQKIGLKENKVYKWLWDQRNKEIKATKFVVKKDGNKNNNNNENINDNKSDEDENDNDNDEE